MKALGEHISPGVEIRDCRDEKDSFLLSLAVSGSADYLISGDDDLLMMKQISTTKIISFTEFEQIIFQLK